MENIISYPRAFTKREVRQEFGADGNDQVSLWHYGDYEIWFMHLAKQKTNPSFWRSTANNGRVNIMYQDKDRAIIIEILGDGEHKSASTKPHLVFASNDESSNYEFKGVFSCSDTEDGVIDHVFKRISTGFDTVNKCPV